MNEHKKVKLGLRWRTVWTNHRLRIDERFRFGRKSRIRNTHSCGKTMNSISMRLFSTTHQRLTQFGNWKFKNLNPGRKQQQLQQHHWTEKNYEKTKSIQPRQLAVSGDCSKAKWWSSMTRLCRLHSENKADENKTKMSKEKWKISNPCLCHTLYSCQTHRSVDFVNCRQRTNTCTAYGGCEHWSLYLNKKCKFKEEERFLMSFKWWRSILSIRNRQVCRTKSSAALFSRRRINIVFHFFEAIAFEWANETKCINFAPFDRDSRLLCYHILTFHLNGHRDDSIKQIE